MLIKELIARYVGPQGALHERGIQLDEAQVPPGVRVHHADASDAGDTSDGDGAEGDRAKRDEPSEGDVDGRVDGGDANAGDAGDALDRDHAVAVVAGDLVLVSVPAGPGLPGYVDTNLPVGATIAMLFEVEVTELPVDRLLAALAVAKLQVVEAAVLSGTPTATVAVVATRTDELVAPAPDLAHNLEPGDHEGPAALRRLLGEHVLEALVRPARERVLRVQAGETEARLAEVNKELAEVNKEMEKLRTEGQNREAALARDLDKARKAADLERKRILTLRSSRAFKVASRLIQMSGVARRVIRRPGPGKPPA